MALTYHIKIKEDYAASMIEDLQRKGAIEVIETADSSTVPDWQVTEVRTRAEKYRNSPELLIDENEVFKMLDAE